MLKELVVAISEIKEEDAFQLVEKMLKDGAKPVDILDACREATEIIGQRFSDKEYFLPDLIMSGEILKEIAEKIKPYIEETVKTETIGKVVLGTVSGDIHDIGKDIVGFMLETNGFEVHDIGVDMPPEAFVEKIREVQPDVVGMSGFLTIAFETMKETVEAIEAAGLRDSLKIMIGGGTVTDHIRKYTRADAFGEDAVKAVALAKEWVGGANNG